MKNPTEKQKLENRVKNLTKLVDHYKDILQKYNNTLLDGEYVYNEKYKKYIFLAFDILFLKNEKILIDNFKERYKLIIDVINNIFNINYNITTITNLSENNIKKYVNELINNFINKVTNNMKI